jgi:hypothetical protein
VSRKIKTAAKKAGPMVKAVKKALGKGKAAAGGSKAKSGAFDVHHPDSIKPELAKWCQDKELIPPLVV